jgi:hypothetical protein
MYKALLTRLANEFTIGRSDLKARRDAWPALAARARSAWEAIAAEQLDLLYFHESTTDNGLHGITLWFGSHPIGLEEKSGELISESGCALSAGQDLNGFVYFVLQPFTSKLHPEPTGTGSNRILLWCFKHPDRVSQSTLRRFAIYLLCLAHATSVLGRPTGWKMRVVGFLRWRSKWLGKSWAGRIRSGWDIAKGVLEKLKPLSGGAHEADSSD